MASPRPDATWWNEMRVNDTKRRKMMKQETRSTWVACYCQQEPSWWFMHGHMIHPITNHKIKEFEGFTGSAFSFFFKSEILKKPQNGEMVRPSENQSLAPSQLSDKWMATECQWESYWSFFNEWTLFRRSWAGLRAANQRRGPGAGRLTGPTRTEGVPNQTETCASGPITHLPHSALLGIYLSTWTKKKKFVFLQQKLSNFTTFSFIWRSPKICILRLIHFFKK